ncbi:putative RNA ligase [uncultured Caudovirales phage]|uniref:Putative RNA ligase n=1 Tax=uncultured Caudovirales phage TaxID=2100421 RepID=A0A6J5PGT3_9CAUD|nr:putative RNA ligase [uncultured Caudovirales phage]CAB4170663.1 putative RNA ligase [uncultured Caudovirales phage]CAB4198505.1 putative RNA ligase [uncultured Caudovirales phage]
MENQNSVCYVGRVAEIKAIDGADNIELAVVGGWNAIVKKGAQTAGEHVVIMTTDAVVPLEISDAIGVTGYLRKGQRVRTVKLRGVYSECLIVSLDSLPQMKKQYASGIGYFWEEGDDLMDLLGIFKYEPPVKQIQLASGKSIKYRSNPHFAVYYKFPNLKNVPGMFTKEDIVQITRKLHGTNARYGIVKKAKLSFMDRVKKFFRLADKLVGYEYVYGSHNVEKGSDSQGFYSTDVWRTIADKYDIKNKLRKHALHLLDCNELGSGIVIYGEIYGAGIQKNYDYGLLDIEFAGFDVVVSGKYDSVVMADWMLSQLDLPIVETLYVGNWSQEVQDQFVFNNFIEGTKVPHEGIVIKHVSGERNRIAKVINPDYLIYGEKHNVGDSH